MCTFNFVGLYVIQGDLGAKLYICGINSHIIQMRISDCKLLETWYLVHLVISLKIWQ